MVDALTVGAIGSGVAIMTGREIESVEVAGSLEKRYLKL